MSFKIGDIVTPRPAYIGNGYRFKIISDTGNPIWSHYWSKRYKLERVGDLFDPLYGPFQYQMDKLKKVEELLWSEAELDDAYKYNPKPYDYGIARDAADSLAYATKVMGVPTSQVNITGDSIQAHIPTPDKPQELVSTVKLKLKNKNLFDGGILSEDTILLENPVYEYYKKLCNKEENIMDILNLYQERKEKEIGKEYEEERQKIMEQDTIQSIIIEMQDQVNAILESEDLKGRLKVYEENLHTRETEEKLNKLRTETDKKEQELRSTLDEIRALFEMTEDYNERIKILKKYEILNKDGKLSV